MAWTEKQLRDVLTKNEAWLMSKPGIQAVGIGLGDSGEPVLEIGTAGIEPKERQQIKARLGRVPVRFYEIGEITPQ
jgi:hypothetical protein